MPEYPLHKCPLPEAKILADLESVANDVRLVLDILAKLLRTQDDDVLSSALFSAGLITYRRCFNSGVRNGLTRGDVLALPVDAIELHDYLIHQANKLTAHSVNPFDQMEVGVSVIDGQIGAVGSVTMRLAVFLEESIRQWGSLVKLIGNTVLNPRIDAARAAAWDAVKALPITEVTKWPTLRFNPPGPDQAGKRRP